MRHTENVSRNGRRYQCISLTRRAGLIQTATLEHEVVNTKVADLSRSTTAGEQSPTLFKRVADVEKSIEDNTSVEGEVIQARAAVLWAHWVAPEQNDPPDSVLWSKSSPITHASPWTNICIVKSAYIKGAILRRRGQPAEAAAASQLATAWIESNQSTVAGNAQLAYWVEQLLSEVAVEKCHAIPKGKSDPVTTSCFRGWSLLASKGKEISPRLYGNPGPHRSRLSVWRIYYNYLSDALQSLSRSDRDMVNDQPDLVTELRRVETAYENELLRNTQFPKADDSNDTIEQWVEQVIRNWEVICGSSWAERDIGEGGRNSYTRTVLDILYRAAMKTFHSTLILRRLFQVHKALAEFDLAYAALDSYLELIDRGRARAAKTKEPQDQDDDELVLLAVSEGILGLCSLNRTAEAEKAENLCRRLETLFDEVDPSAATLQGQRPDINGFKEKANDVLELVPTTIEVVHRALGIGKAHWATWTPFNEHRTSLQTQALAHLRAAASLPLSVTQKQHSYFALIMLLAQTREIDAAIEYAKEALGDRTATGSDHYAAERKLLPLWHLLSLLLTAKQDYDTSSKACVAAFEQFPSPDALFGQGHPSDEEKSPPAHALVDDMECAELQCILEVRMTELALIDLTEGPEDAVNNTNDLLSLYSRLFGRLDVIAEEKMVEKTPDPPKTSAGTVKSLRGSIFRRSRAVSSQAPSIKTNGAASIKTDTTRPATGATEAPTIHVTDEDEKHSPHKHRFFRHSHEQSRKSRLSSDSHTTTLSTRLRSSSHERKHHPVPSTIASSRQSFETGVSAQPSSTGTIETARPQLEPIQSVDTVPTQQSPISAAHNADTSTKQPLGEIPHNLASHDDAPPPIQHSHQPPMQDTRLPTLLPSTSATSPIPRFPLAAARKHALTILTSIWLTIARLYRRASMFEDSREATDEAAKAALKIEALVASTVESSARAFADPGLGSGGKSSDDCWADVFCERGELLLAITDARTETTPSQDVKSAERDEGIREGVAMLEQALMYSQRHLRAGVVLSNVLLDYYERKVELGRRGDDDEAALRKLGAVIPWNTRTERKAERTPASPSPLTNGTQAADGLPTSTPEGLTDDDLKKTPENLNRLAARDRAYGLLSSLTKGGEGWDDSEAWFALARAHELGGEVEKAKEILWWVVRLEDTRPLRRWECVNAGGYVL